MCTKWHTKPTLNAHQIDINMTLKQYNEPEKKIRVTNEIAVYFLSYLHKIAIESTPNSLGISFQNDIESALHQYNFNSVREKFQHFFARKLYATKNKSYSLKVNRAERLTMSIMFKHYDVRPELRDLELQILDQLTIKTYTNGQTN